MSIVLSEIKWKFPQTNGTMGVHEEHTDTNGIVHVNLYKTTSDVEQAVLDANLIANVASMDERLERMEVVDTIDLLREGTLLQNVTFLEQTNTIGRSRVVKEMLRGDVNDVIVISYILDDFTDTQIKNLIGVDQATYDRLKIMMQKARAFKADLDAVINDADRGNV